MSKALEKSNITMFVWIFWSKDLPKSWRVVISSVSQEKSERKPWFRLLRILWQLRWDMRWKQLCAQEAWKKRRSRTRVGSFPPDVCPPFWRQVLCWHVSSLLAVGLYRLSTGRYKSVPLPVQWRTPSRLGWGCYLGRLLWKHWFSAGVFQCCVSRS